MVLLELKNTISGEKNTLDNSITKRRQILKIVQSLRNYGKITKCWTFRDILEKTVVLKTVWRNNGSKLTNLVKDIYIQSQRTWNRVNRRKFIPRHVIINWKNKNKKILKRPREIWHYLYRNNNLNDREFLIRNHWGGEKRQNILKLLKEKNCI